jgi:very-short-patch-repair endonuclease
VGEGQGEGSFQKMEANITKLAKKLGKGQTDAESLLWKHLRIKQMEVPLPSREGNPFVRVINGVIHE